MPNDWGALGLGGRVDIRGATPPIGNTGPGGAAGMGLLALLRRLSMGLDEPPEPMSPDPASERGMAQVLGLPGAPPMMQGPMMADDLSGGAGMDQMQMGIQGPAPTDIEAMGPEATPMEPSAFDFEQAFGRPYTPPEQPPPEQQDPALWEEMMRRMGAPY